MSNLGVLILAGGNSSRMGSDKAILHWEGHPLLWRVCQVAQQLSPFVQVLSPWPERYAELIPEGVGQYLEPVPGRGPLWALQFGLSQMTTPWVLLLACDMPHLDYPQLELWRSQLSDLPADCLAYVPQTQPPNSSNIRWEPLCGFYRRAATSHLQEFLAGGGKSFQDWLTQIGAIAPSTADDALFYNCNYPEDLRVELRSQSL